MHDVFISYKSEDSAVAMQVMNKLEENGIPCWIAERDISAGSNYAADIPAAIGQCRVLVLILTNAAQSSPWIMKELDSAIAGHKLILPLKIGNFTVSGAMSFLLTGVQYFDATAFPEETVDALIHRIRQAIANKEGGDHQKSKKLKVRRSHGCLIFLTVMALILAAIQHLGIFDFKAFAAELPGSLEQLPAYAANKIGQMIVDLAEMLNAG